MVKAEDAALSETPVRDAWVHIAHSEHGPLTRLSCMFRPDARASLPSKPAWTLGDKGDQSMRHQAGTNHHEKPILAMGSVIIPSAMPCAAATSFAGSQVEPW